MSDPYRNDPDRRVVVEREDSSMGLLAGLAVIALLIAGGLYFYYNGAPTTVAVNTAPSTTSSPMTPAPAPAAPSITPSAPATPTPSAPAR